MVEDRVLEEITIKAKNLLKHYPCRRLRLIEVSELVSEPSVGFAIKIVAKGPNWRSEKISLFKKKDLKDPNLAKRCVEKLMKDIPESFAIVNIINVKTIAEDLMHNFSEKNVPDTFCITKLPYRQLQIVSNNSKIFLKLNVKSYQKILNFFDTIESWPAEIDFSELSGLLKRKELITLFLYLANTNI